MKLLLTSTGLANENVKSRFISLFNKDFSKIKLLFVVSAAEKPKEKWYINKSEEELLALGIKKENFVTYHTGQKSSKEVLDTVDLIYVCGGNTFLLLEEIKKSGLDKDIIGMIKKEVFYIGASAGSLIVTPNIKIAEPWDPNVNGLKDLSGFNLTDFTIAPHYTKEEEKNIKNMESILGIEVKRITDDQAILLIDDNIEVIN